MRRRVSTVLSLTVSAVATMMIATTAPALASSGNLPGCPDYYVCVYDGSSVYSNVLLRTKGNWHGSIEGAGLVVNNGHVYPGADHIQVDWYHYVPMTGWVTESSCLHYYPGFPTGDTYKIAIDGTVTDLVWRGECW